MGPWDLRIGCRVMCGEDSEGTRLIDIRNYYDNRNCQHHDGYVAQVCDPARLLARTTHVERHHPDHERGAVNAVEHICDLFAGP